MSSWDEVVKEDFSREVDSKLWIKGLPMGHAWHMVISCPSNSQDVSSWGQGPFFFDSSIFPHTEHFILHIVDMHKDLLMKEWMIL